MSSASALKAIRDQITAIEAAVTTLPGLKDQESKLAALVRAEELEASAAEATAAAAAIRASLAPAPAPKPVKTTLPVFCTGDRGNLGNGNMQPSNFNDMIAFSYSLNKDLTVPFTTIAKDEFKNYLTTLRRSDDGTHINSHVAGRISTFMSTATENIGKQIVVALDKPYGGGLEIREITGPYRYNETFRYKDGGLGYFHQFPTKLIRKLTPKESNEVVEARKKQAPRGLNWSVDLIV